MLRTHPTYNLLLLIANVASTCLITCLNINWIVGSGSTDHICSNMYLLDSYHLFDKKPDVIIVDDGKSVEVKHSHCEIGEWCFCNTPYFWN